MNIRYGLLLFLGLIYLNPLSMEAAKRHKKNIVKSDSIPVKTMDTDYIGASLLRQMRIYYDSVRQKMTRWDLTQHLIEESLKIQLPMDSIIRDIEIKRELELHHLDSAALAQIINDFFKYSLPNVAQRQEQERAPGPWKVGGYISLGGTQTALKNWSAGGENTYALVFEGKVHANYLSHNSVFENNAELKYGVKQNGETPWYKSDDKFEINSKYGFRASPSWSYTAAMNFKTQLAKGYTNNVLSSNFMSPTYLSMSLGLEYASNDRGFTINMSPLTYDLTFLLHSDLSSRYGILEGKRYRATFGALLNTEYRFQVMENVRVESRFRIFADYLSMNIDCFKASLDLTVFFKINRFLGAKLECNFIWDPRYKFGRTDAYGFVYSERHLQIKEQLSLTFIHNFGHK